MSNKILKVLMGLLAMLLIMVELMLIPTDKNIAALVYSQRTRSATHSFMNSTQTSKLSNNPDNTEYSLFYYDGYAFYDYKPGDLMPKILHLPIDITSHFDANLLVPSLPVRSVVWSDKNNSFVVVSNDTSGSGALFRISQSTTNHFTAAQINLDNSSGKFYVSAAQWSSDGKALAVILDYPNSVVDGGNWYFLSLSVYTFDGKLKTVIYPGIRDADGQPTLLFTNDTHDYVVDMPNWSPDDKNIAFTTLRQTSYHDLPFARTSYITRFIDTKCLDNLAAPCKILVLPQSTSENWTNFTWLPDSKHLIFDCSDSNDIDNANIINNDLCTIAMDGSELKHLFLPEIDNILINNPILYALSPTGKTMSYTQPTSNKIFIYDVAAGNIISKILLSPVQNVSDAKLAFMVWIPAQVTQALIDSPTFTPPPPSLTPIARLSLKPTCISAAWISLNQDIWIWSIVNPNSSPVSFSMTWYDIISKRVETANAVVNAAHNGVPSVRSMGALTQPGTIKVDLYVNGILQDEQAVPPLPCPTLTVTPPHL